MFNTLRLTFLFVKIFVTIFPHYNPLNKHFFLSFHEQTIFFPQVAEQTIYFPLFAEKLFFKTTQLDSPLKDSIIMNIKYNMHVLVCKYCKCLSPIIEWSG